MPWRHQFWMTASALTVEDGDRLYVHASAAAPARFDYVTDERTAGASLQATRAAHHVLRPHARAGAVSSLGRPARSRISIRRPASRSRSRRTRRWLAVIGAVGQPRDRNPAACYALYDDATRTLTYVRVPYDVDTAARKIRAAGLPPVLATRLASGR